MNNIKPRDLKETGKIIKDLFSGSISFEHHDIICQEAYKVDPLNYVDYLRFAVENSKRELTEVEIKVMKKDILEILSKLNNKVVA